MKALAFAVVLAAGLAVIAPRVCGQARFGYGSAYSDGYYREAARGYGIVPYQNSQFGYGSGQFGYGNSRFGQGNTRFGEQYSPYGEQPGSYGSQYSNYGGQIPSDWTPTNPVYNPVLAGTVPPPQLVGPPLAAAQQTPPISPVPTTRPAAPAVPKAAPTTQPSRSG